MNKNDELWSLLHNTSEALVNLERLRRCEDYERDTEFMRSVVDMTMSACVLEMLVKKVIRENKERGTREDI